MAGVMEVGAAAVAMACSSSSSRPLLVSPSRSTLNGSSCRGSKVSFAGSSRRLPATAAVGSTSQQRSEGIVCKALENPSSLQVRKSPDRTRAIARCRGANSISLRGALGLPNLSSSSFGNRRNSYGSGLVKVCASVEEGVKSSENSSVEEIRTSTSNGTNGNSAGEEIRTSTSNSDLPKLESPPASPSSPFASGKISSRIAAKQTGESKLPVSASTPQKAAPVKKPATKVNPPVVGQLSVNAASQLKVNRPPSVFTVPTKPADGKPRSPFSQPGGSNPESPANPFRKNPIVPADWEKAGARKAGAGKKVLEAFREGEKDGFTTKFGQPLVPSNIFDEVRRTPEEIAADAFKFQISPGQFFLVGSFLVIIAVMFGTVFLVWKVGAIHYNEY